MADMQIREIGLISPYERRISAACMRGGYGKREVGEEGRVEEGEQEEGGEEKFGGKGGREKRKILRALRGEEGDKGVGRGGGRVRVGGE